MRSKMFDGLPGFYTIPLKNISAYDGVLIFNSEWFYLTTSGTPDFIGFECNLDKYIFFNMKHVSNAHEFANL